MDKKVKIAIIGAGTAGLSAFKEASKYTDSIILIDNGPLGTTCARVGCMPSKLLIHVANEFYQPHHFKKLGIHGAEHLTVNIVEALKRVQSMRDKFTNGVVKFTQSLGEQFIGGEAKFIDANTLAVGKDKIIADKIIIATGSSSIVPKEWSAFGEKILISENIFERNDFAKTMAVIGGGIIGLELGQALSRLGIQLSLYHANAYIGGLTDPKVNESAIDILKNEFAIFLNEQAAIKSCEHDALEISTSSQQNKVEQILVAIGRTPNLKHLNLSALDIQLDGHGIPVHDKTTLQIADHPIYIVGDANKERPLLHEAADEGRIAGFNASREENKCFKRRTPLRILFSQPNIAVVGTAFNELPDNEYVIGEINFSDQGRAKIELNNKGLLRVYGSKKTGVLLGAEFIAPAGEHLAHLLAWAIQQELTVFDVLQMPFYHPVVEEGMRTALRDMAKKVECKTTHFDLAMCDSEAVHSLS